MDERVIKNTDWFKSLLEDCQSIIVEYGFTSRWAVIEGYHALGKRIIEENDNFERAKIYGKKIVHECAESLGKSERIIYYAIQFYKKYPDLSLLPEGKNVSWGKIKTKYLPEPNLDEVSDGIPHKSNDLKESPLPKSPQTKSSDSDVNNLKRQQMIDVLTLGPLIFLTEAEKQKLIAYNLAYGHIGFSEYTDEQLKTVMEELYDQDQIALLSEYCTIFYEDFLEDVKGKANLTEK